MFATNADGQVFTLAKGLTGANVIKALMVRHFPYTWCYDNWYEVKKYKDGTRDLFIKTITFDKLDKKNVQIRFKIVQIIDELKINDKMNDYTKARLLAEYIATHCKYRDKDDAIGYQTWDCLVNQSAICCGYSEAYKALCDYVDLRCQCVTSHDHQWNRVVINGKWVNVDTCWMSTTGRYDLYCLTNDKVFYENHMKYVKKMSKYWKYN